MASLYASSDLEIRADLDDAHRETIDAWASPGDWWTATERLAMVAEVRRAKAADELPPWVRPTTVDGLIDPDHLLPEAAIDAIWRLTNHSATLTADWYAENIEAGITAEQYVELVSVVATANCLDVFAAAIGAEPLPLPVPAEGQPSRTMVSETAVRSHWVPTLDVGGANVGKALTSVPIAVEAWLRLSGVQYVPRTAVRGDMTWSRGNLDRMQVELLAARTSLLNECFY